MKKSSNSFMRYDSFGKNIGLLSFLMVLAISIGGLTEIFPLFLQDMSVKSLDGMRPRSALEVEGRDVYIANGCVQCHSQMIRPLIAETERYGHYSLAEESVWDHPFLWGSKRTGPDLARIGKRYPDKWHKEHISNPRNVVKQSIMPAYPFLQDKRIDYKNTPKKMRILRKLGVPYTDKEITSSKDLVKGKTELDALIAYLQSLGNVMNK